MRKKWQVQRKRMPTRLDGKNRVIEGDKQNEK
jgi:hypothetical protein